jgi:hypothetical protein
MQNSRKWSITPHSFSSDCSYRGTIFKVRGKKSGFTAEKLTQSQVIELILTIIGHTENMGF